MIDRPKSFSIHVENATLVVAPTGPISNLSGPEVHPEVEAIMAALRDGRCQNVLVDMERATFFGSVLLGLLSLVWRQLRPWQGRLVLCNLSGLGGEIIHAAKFDTLWEIYPTLDEAKQAIAQPAQIAPHSQTHDQAAG